MPVSRHAIALWRLGPEQLWFGALGEEPELSALGETREACLKQLRGAMLRRFEENPWLPASPDQQPRLQWVSLEVHPEVRHKEKRYPLEQALPVSLPCVLLQDADGAQLCSLPTLGVVFYFQPGRVLRELVHHFLIEQLRGLSPGQVLALQTPTHFEVAELRVKVRRERVAPPRPEAAALSQVASPLKARKIRAFQRESLVAELARRLEEGASVLLVGEPGVGKTSLLVEVARAYGTSLPGRVRAGEKATPRPTLWQSSAARVVAGMQYLGQWEERLETVVEELQKNKGILCFDSLIALLQMGGTEVSGSIAAFLRPWLEQGEVQLVVEATPEEWLAAQRLLGPFVDMFQVLQVPAMDAAATLDVLSRLRTQLEQSRRLPISPQVEAQVVRLVSRFQPYAALPGGCTKWLRALADDPDQGVDTDALLARFSRDTGIPEHLLRDEVLLSESEVRAGLERSVLGQPAAIEAATRLITMIKSGLTDPGRPLSVMLLCGPTGTGKTELARCLTRELFGDLKRLIRLDMSEYAGPGAAERLLGAAFDAQPPLLIRRIRRQPFSVVLLDEVEKAHPEVFDLLLRVLDEGKLCDSYGRVTHFGSSVILMTSNLGVPGGHSLGFTTRPATADMAAVRRFFRPEFLNRVDEIVQFQPLSRERVRDIARKEVAELQQRSGLKRRGLRLQPTEALLQMLVDTGYDARYGARPLQRALERTVVRSLAQVLADTPQGWRDLVLQVDWDGSEVVVTPL